MMSDPVPRYSREDLVVRANGSQDDPLEALLVIYVQGTFSNDLLLDGTKVTGRFNHFTNVVFYIASPRLHSSYLDPEISTIQPEVPRGPCSALPWTHDVLVVHGIYLC